MHGLTISDPISKANVLNSYLFESVSTKEDIFTMGMWEEDGRWSGRCMKHFIVHSQDTPMHVATFLARN